MAKNPQEPIPFEYLNRDTEKALVELSQALKKLHETMVERMEATQDYLSTEDKDERRRKSWHQPAYHIKIGEDATKTKKLVDALLEDSRQMRDLKPAMTALGCHLGTMYADPGLGECLVTDMTLKVVDEHKQLAPVREHYEAQMDRNENSGCNLIRNLAGKITGRGNRER